MTPSAIALNIEQLTPTTVKRRKGPFRRFILLATCTTFQQLILEQGTAGPIIEDALGVKELLSDSDLCPAS